MATTIFSCRDENGNIVFDDNQYRTSCIGQYPLCRAADGTLWVYVPGCDGYQGSDGWYPVCQGPSTPYGGPSILKIQIPDCCTPIKLARQAWEDMVLEEQPGDIDYDDFYLDIYGSENSLAFTPVPQGIDGYWVYRISATRAGVFKAVYVAGDAGWSHRIKVYKNGVWTAMSSDTEIPYAPGDILRIYLDTSDTTNGYDGWNDELRPDGLAPCHTTFY